MQSIDAKPLPESSAYQRMGGETAVRALIDRFYDLMDASLDYFAIRKLHPDTLEGSRERLFMFLSGWLGGPQLYMETYGHPRLRARHLHVAIGIAERDQWMECMSQAMQETGIPDDLRRELVESFGNTADWMRNREP
jgi:hemoglobin